ncbi:hypothetical protein [Musicola paradisiaca]|nr:hypothetical protein [Musicola paradisiaca]
MDYSTECLHVYCWSQFNSAHGCSSLPWLFGEAKGMGPQGYTQMVG